MKKTQKHISKFPKMSSYLSNASFIESDPNWHQIRPQIDPKSIPNRLQNRFHLGPKFGPNSAQITSYVPGRRYLMFYYELKEKLLKGLPWHIVPRIIWFLLFLYLGFIWDMWVHFIWTVIVLYFLNHFSLVDNKVCCFLLDVWLI